MTLGMSGVFDLILPHERREAVVGDATPALVEPLLRSLAKIPLLLCTLSILLDAILGSVLQALHVRRWLSICRRRTRRGGAVRKPSSEKLRLRRWSARSTGIEEHRPAKFEEAHLKRKRHRNVAFGCHADLHSSKRDFYNSTTALNTSACIFRP